MIRNWQDFYLSVAQLTGRDDPDSLVVVRDILCPPIPSPARLPGSRLLAAELGAPGLSPRLKDGRLWPKEDEYRFKLCGMTGTGTPCPASSSWYSGIGGVGLD
jgi:hypothetical protein